jgi:hypothetical protein
MNSRRLYVAVQSFANAKHWVLVEGYTIEYI